MLILDSKMRREYDKLTCSRNFWWDIYHSTNYCRIQNRYFVVNQHYSSTHRSFMQLMLPYITVILNIIQHHYRHSVKPQYGSLSMPPGKKLDFQFYGNKTATMMQWHWCHKNAFHACSIQITVCSHAEFQVLYTMRPF